VHSYKITFESATGQTTASPKSVDVTHDATHTETIVYLPIGAAGTTKRTIYRTAAGGATWYKLASILDNETLSYLDLLPDGSLGAGVPPTVNTANNGRVQSGVLTTTYGVMVEKASEVQVDIATLTGTSLDDLSVQLDYSPCAV
jgi:hypothetical protein